MRQTSISISGHTIETLARELGSLGAARDLARTFAQQAPEGVVNRSSYAQDAIVDWLAKAARRAHENALNAVMETKRTAQAIRDVLADDDDLGGLTHISHHTRTLNVARAGSDSPAPATAGTPPRESAAPQSPSLHLISATVQPLSQAPVAGAVEAPRVVLHKTIRSPRSLDVPATAASAASAAKGLAKQVGQMGLFDQA